MKSKAREGFLGALAVCLGCLVLFPLFYGFMGAFKSPAEFVAWPPTVFPRSFGYLKNFETVFTQLPMLRYFWNTLVVSVFSTVVKLTIALLAAYAFVYFDFAGKKALFFLLLGTMMLPPDTLTITNYQTVSHLGLLDTYLGIGIVSFVGASQMFMLRQHFLSSPKPLREAAQMDGCGDLRFIVFILTPMSLPLLLTLFLQAFVIQWNAYLWPKVVMTDNRAQTMPMLIANLASGYTVDYGMLMMGVLFCSLPTVIIFFILQKQFAEGITRAVK